LFHVGSAIISTDMNVNHWFSEVFSHGELFGELQSSIHPSSKEYQKEKYINIFWLQDVHTLK